MKPAESARNKCASVLDLYRHQSNARVPFSAALETALAAVRDKALADERITPDTAAALDGWLANANPEALKDWMLDRGGWQKLLPDADALAKDLDQWPAVLTDWALVEWKRPGQENTPTDPADVVANYMLDDAALIVAGDMDAVLDDALTNLPDSDWEAVRRQMLSMDPVLSRMTSAQVFAFDAKICKSNEAETDAYLQSLADIENRRHPPEAKRVFFLYHGKLPLPPLKIPGACAPVQLASLDGLKIALRLNLWEPLAVASTGTDWKPLNPPAKWLRLLVLPWIQEAAERATIQAKALPLVIQRRNVITAPSTGAAFLRFPSMLKDAGAWCGALVPVDGDTIFAEEPDLAATPLRVLKDADGAAVQLYKPRAWTVAAERRLAGPRQMVMPGMNLDPQHNPDLGAFLAVTATGAAVLDRLPGLCAKLLPLLFALCPLDGTPVKGHVKDLVKLLYPDWKKRRQMAGDVARVGAAAAALRALRIVEALPTGALRVYPVTAGGFYDIPTGPGQEPEACLRLNPELAALATPAKGKGDFVLLNLSRLMELDAQSPDRIAVALRLAAYWHTCKQRTADGRRAFMPERVDFLPVDELLVTINAPGRAADVIAGEDTSRMGRRKLTEERARMVDVTLPALVEAGLVGKVDTRRGVQRAGGAWMVKAEPPADYLEASRKTARTGRQPPKGRRRK